MPVSCLECFENHSLTSITSGVQLVLGHDGGHTPVTIIGARDQDSVETYAALASAHAGTRQHVTNLVLPWLREFAPWTLRAPSMMFRHYYDPSMATGEQVDIDQDRCGWCASCSVGP